MSIDALRKRLQEIQESLASGNTQEIPGMENPSQPAAPSPVDTYQPPEVDVPDVQEPETEPIAPVSTPAIIPAVNIPAPSTNTTSNQTKVDPKTGAAGAKTMEDIAVTNPKYAESGIANDDLINAYNAGLNGEDMSRETRDNAAAGGYLEQLEAMYNAGLQDAKPVDSAVKTPSVDNVKVNVPSINNMKVNMPSIDTAQNNTPKYVDNPANLGYTPGNTTGDTGVGTNTNNEEVPKMGAAPNSDTAGSNNNMSTGSSNSTPDDNLINKYEEDYNYIADMMFLNGAASSSDPSVQIAYQYITNSENKGKQIPPQVMKAYEDFMNDVNKKSGNRQIERSHKIAMGDADINNYDYEDIKKRNETLLNPTADMSAISNAFGELDDYSGDYHLGIDIKKADGVNSQIHAAFYGEIVYKGWAKDVVNNNDNGYMIIIRHKININGEEVTFYSGYFHLDPTATEKIGLSSNYVYPGTVIAIMGNTGHSTGPHLHFTIFTTTRKINKDFNPTGYTPKKINGYTCPSSSGDTIFYDPMKVLETNGAILR